jgi:hypothetical protein
MENVYVVAIIAAAIVAAIVGVAWLLRDRITAGRFGASALDKKVEAEIKAAPPEKVRRRPLPPARGQRSSVDISGNWMVGSQVVRIWRNSVNFARNRLVGKQRYEVKPESTRPAARPAKKRRRKK